MTLTPQRSSVAASLCSHPLTGGADGVSDADLADILGAWLADEFARDSHRHIHSIEETER